MNGHGGKRPGAGRPRGAASRANDEVRQEAAATGELPLRMTCCGSCAIRASRSAGVTIWPRPPLRSATRAFRRLSIRVRSRARRSFALPLFRQPSTSGRRNTCRAQRGSTDGGWRESRHCVHDRVGPQKGPQTALLACPVFEVFFGGARGGGKTDAALGEFVIHADQHAEHAIGLMVRRTRTELVETIERSKQIYGPLGAMYHTQESMWRFPNGARLRFAYLERDADADAYQGHSYTRVYVEEIGNFPSPVPILKLMATLRSGAGVPCGFRATGNPGGPGHQWVKARYIDPNPAGWEVRKFTYRNPWTRETIEQDRVFIPSKLRTEQISRARVRCKPADGRQRHAGASLARRGLDRNRGCLLRLLAIRTTCGGALRCRPIGPGSGRWTGAQPSPSQWDGGQSSPTTTSPRAEGGPDRLLPRGALVRYREWYGAAAPNVRLKMTAEAVGAGITQENRAIPTCGTGCSILPASRRTAGPRSRSGSTRSLFR